MSFIEYELGVSLQRHRARKRNLMSRHTTYRIGGPARYFIQADTLGSLVDVTELLRCCGIPWIAVGKGSNLLVSDEGFEGAVVVLGAEFNASRLQRTDADLFRRRRMPSVAGCSRGLLARSRGIRIRGRHARNGRRRLAHECGHEPRIHRKPGLVDNLASSRARPQALQRLRRLVGLS